MNPMMIGMVALGVSVLGVLGHSVRFLRARSISFAMLWLIVPLAGALVAFLLAPPSLLTAGLGGAALALAFLTLLAPVVLPVLTGDDEWEQARVRNDADDSSRK